jgi:hypothetical protein
MVQDHRVTKMIANRRETKRSSAVKMEPFVNRDPLFIERFVGTRTGADSFANSVKACLTV